MTTSIDFVRKATAAGALIASPNSPFVQGAIDRISQLVSLPGIVQWCPHLEEAGLPMLLSTVTIWPAPGFGDQAEQLWCVDCWNDPGPAFGCHACDRRPVPGQRRIVSPPTMGPQQIVIVGQLCSYDRRALA